MFCYNNLAFFWQRATRLATSFVAFLFLVPCLNFYVFTISLVIAYISIFVIAIPIPIIAITIPVFSIKIHAWIIKCSFNIPKLIQLD